MAGELRALFNRDLSQSGRELLAVLQSAYPGAFPDGLLRTAPRRLKIWRAEMAQRLVFGTTDGATRVMAPDALRDLGAARVGDHHLRRPEIAKPATMRREHSPEATA